MKQVKLIEFDDGNLAGFSWSWEFVLTKRKDGTFSLRCKQTTADPPAMKIPHIHPIQSGEELYVALESMVSEAGYSVPDDDIVEIAKIVGRLSKPLSREFAESRGYVI